MVYIIYSIHVCACVLQSVIKIVSYDKTISEESYITSHDGKTADLPSNTNPHVTKLLENSFTNEYNLSVLSGLVMLFTPTV